MAHYSPEIFAASDRDLLEQMLDTQRAEIAALLADVSEEEARARLVPSLTTLLGLVKHAAYVERIWFGHRIGGHSLADLGAPPTIDASFTLDNGDTIAAVLTDFEAACGESRLVAAEHGLAEVFAWRKGPVSLGFIYAHLIQEYARHCGHGDIVREQLMAQRA